MDQAVYKDIRKLFAMVIQLKADNKKLGERVNDLEARIKVLENKDIYDILGIKKVDPKDLPNPWEPKVEPAPFVPERPWTFPQYNPKACSKCGLKLEGVMGYSCPNLDCPVGLGPIMCGGNNV